MRLLAKNFRCFPALDITFPDRGLVLLWGNSGVGKTSILKAIHFALYGKELKVVMTGEKKCSVTLMMDETTDKAWTIVRTKGPTHLTLETPNGKFEDDVAQQMILERFGEHFLLTNYIAQKSVNSFFMLSNAEKTSFLHQLVIQQFDVDSLKSRIKNKIRDRRLGLTAISAEVNTYRTMADEIEDVQCPRFPLKVSHTIEETLKEEEERRVKNRDKLTTALAEQLQLKTAQVRYEETRPLLKQLTEFLSRKEQEKAKVQDTLPDEIDLSQWKKVQMEWEAKRSECKRYQEYTRALERYLTKKKDMTESLEEQIQTVRADLEGLEEISPDRISSLQQKIQQQRAYTRMVEKMTSFLRERDGDDFQLPVPFDQPAEWLFKMLKEIINDLEEERKDYDYSTDAVRKEQFAVTISEYRKRLTAVEAQVKGQRLACPGCRINIIYRDNELHPYDHKRIEQERQEIQSDLKQYQRQLDVLTANILQKQSNDSEVQREMMQVKSYLEEVKPFLNQLYSLQGEEEATLEIRELTSIMERRKTAVKQCKLLEDQFAHLDSNPQLTKLKPMDKLTSEGQPQWLSVWLQQEITLRSISEIEEDIVREVNLTTYELEQKREQQQRRKSGLEQIKQIEHEIVQGQEQRSQYLLYTSREEELKKVTEDIVHRQEKAEKFEKRKNSVEKYMQEKEKYDRRQALLEKVRVTISREKIAQRALSKAEELMECVQRAENISLDNCLDLLNQQLDDYMEQFFPDNTIEMNLYSYRENKEGEKKACIDIRVQRDGEMCTIDTLSGGEFDRACLALFLSFNRIANHELLMLDECLSSLHSEAVEDIIEVVKDRYSDRLVLFTLHQANTGLFHSVIDVNELRV